MFYYTRMWFNAKKYRINTVDVIVFVVYVYLQLPQTLNFMKKLIYGITLSIVTVSVVLVACNKQNVSPGHSAGKKPQNTDLEKSVTDVQLISIIQGMDQNYTKIEEVEEVLFDNCQLNSSVLRALIDESKYPNYIVEEMMILSAPVTNADLTYLQNVRPALSTNTIVTAAAVDWTNSEYVIANSEPRQIFVAKNLTRKSLCDDGCGESEYRGTDFVILDLTSATTPLNPAEMIDCDEGRWFCGKLTQTRVALSDGTNTVIVSRCEGSDGKCQRKASATK